MIKKRFTPNVGPQLMYGTVDNDAPAGVMYSGTPFGFLVSGGTSRWWVGAGFHFGPRFRLNFLTGEHCTRKVREQRAKARLSGWQG